jgi:PBP1b-binding outer membrane lipoprotein LpoB
MRTILTATMVVAILFMVGCGATAEEKATMKSNTDQITAMQKNLTALQTTATAVGAKADMMDAFLKAHFKDYGVVDTTKKATTPPPVAPKTPKPPKPTKTTTKK